MADGVKFNPKVALCIADIQFKSSDKVMAVKKCSKIDQWRTGEDIILQTTRKDLYPVVVLKDYLVGRGRQQGPLFCFSDGSLWEGVNWSKWCKRSWMRWD